MRMDIRNFVPLGDKLLSSGMPTANQIDALAREGVQMVINLAPFDPARDLADEGTLVSRAGMDYLNIPVDWEAPTQQDLRAFMDAMDANQERKILVHCRANYRATGFVSLYRVLRQGWEPELAFKELRTIWKPEDYPVWKRFIDDNLSHPGRDRALRSRQSPPTP